MSHQVYCFGGAGSAKVTLQKPIIFFSAGSLFLGRLLLNSICDQERYE
jgi:hypothetical protein